MFSIALALLVAAIGVAAAASMRRDARIDRDFVVRSVGAVLAYALFAVLGMGMAWWIAVDRHAPLAALAFVSGWTVLAWSALVRYAPRLKAPPGATARHVHAAVQLAGAMLAAAALFSAAT